MKCSIVQVHWALLRGAILCALSVPLATWSAASGDSSRWEVHQAAAREAARKGDFNSAELHYGSGLEEARRFGNGDPRLAEAHYDLATIQMMARRFARAESTTRAGMELRSLAGATNDSVDVALTQTLGDALLRQSKYSQSLLTYSNGLAQAKRTFGRFSPPTCIFLAGMARSHAGTSNYTEADKLFKEAIKAAETPRSRISQTEFGDRWDRQRNWYSPKPDFLAFVLHQQGIVLGNLGKLDEAASAMKKSLKLFDEMFSEEGTAHVSVLTSLAFVQLRQTKFKEAEASISRAVATMKKTVGFESEVGREVLALYARILRAQNKELSVEPVLARLPELFLKFPPGK